MTSGSSMARCTPKAWTSPPISAGPERNAAYPKVTTTASIRPPPR